MHHIGVGDENFSRAAQREIVPDEHEFDGQRGDQGERREVMQEGEQRRHRVVPGMVGEQDLRRSGPALQITSLATGPAGGPMPRRDTIGLAAVRGAR